MKKILFAAIALVISATSFAQSYRLTWGEEIKLRKGTSDLDIVAADNTGIFFTEERRKMKNYFVIGATYGASYRLVKTDKNFGELFDKEYKRELKGLDYHSFESLGEDLFMFASEYSRKNKEFIILGAKIDKRSGDLAGDFSELGSYRLESKRDDYEMKVVPALNGSSFLMVSNISGKDRVSLGVSILDKNLKKKENTLINLTFDPGLYELQDIKYTNNGKVIILGKVFEEAQIGKRKKKRLVFKEYVMDVYNMKGEREKEITLDAEDRYIISGKLIEQPTGEMLLAGFYSKNARKEDLSGFYINKVDPEKGTLVLSSFKDINSGMLGKPFADDSDDDEETKKDKKAAQKAKDDDEEEEFPNQFIIKSVDINPADNSVIITSEISKYTYYSYSSSSYNTTTRTWQTTTTHIHRFTNQDILVINADKDGNIRWMNDLPKSQIEEVRTSNTGYGSGYSYGYDRGSYFATAGGMPFHSSYVSMINNNSLVLLFNDHNSNNVNPGYGDRVKSVYNFRKRSSVYGISIDLASGKMTRKSITSNNEGAILMPRHAFVVKNEFIVPSWRQHLMAKTELKFAKIAVK